MVTNGPPLAVIPLRVWGQYHKVPHVFKAYMSSNDFISGINNINESDALLNHIQYSPPRMPKKKTNWNPMIKGIFQ
ncbi:hypothetical protein PFDG_04981 [Plasmodium falciparum Dd2]|uniref:Uncharacterized protein n=1 Tax=Plasmodium falciparum (isolate Dd2) TaxID=57267 RepID=A0A0L7M9B1_PLAF4|nr:hypothetical protein PFDG_04981 [Plasmodium falciparum Dd2]